MARRDRSLRGIGVHHDGTRCAGLENQWVLLVGLYYERSSWGVSASAAHHLCAKPVRLCSSDYRGWRWLASCAGCSVGCRGSTSLSKGSFCVDRLLAVLPSPEQTGSPVDPRFTTRRVAAFIDQLLDQFQRGRAQADDRVNVRSLCEPASDRTAIAQGQRRR